MTNYQPSTSDATIDSYLLPEQHQRNDEAVSSSDRPLLSVLSVVLGPRHENIFLGVHDNMFVSCLLSSQLLATLLCMQYLQYLLFVARFPWSQDRRREGAQELHCRSQTLCQMQIFNIPFFFFTFLSSDAGANFVRCNENSRMMGGPIATGILHIGMVTSFCVVSGNPATKLAVCMYLPVVIQTMLMLHFVPKLYLCVWVFQPRGHYILSATLHSY